MILSTINKHLRDDRIQFEDTSHSYTIDGNRDGWISCTKFLHTFFKPFDANAVIRSMMRKMDSTNKYFGMTSTEIKKQWDDKGKSSSEAGTRLHLDIEHFYNNIHTPTECAEWSLFRDFHREFVEVNHFIPFRTEWLVFDTEFKIAGSIDMVYKKPDGTFAIYDWKRSEDIKTVNTFQSGLEPLSHLPDSNYWHYSLQLNIYRFILQKNYDVVVSELALVILHPNNSKWRVMKLNFMDDDVNDMMVARLAVHI